MKISEDSIKYTSFVTPVGKFGYLRCSFDLTNIPKVFSRFMHIIFEKLIRENIIFLDPGAKVHPPLTRFSQEATAFTDAKVLLPLKRPLVLPLSVQPLSSKIVCITLCLQKKLTVKPPKYFSSVSKYASIAKKM